MARTVAAKAATEAIVVNFILNISGSDNENGSGLVDYESFETQRNVKNMNEKLKV